MALNSADCVDLLFRQTSLLKRISSLYALVEHVRGRRRIAASKARELAEELTCFDYGPVRKGERFVDRVVPTAKTCVNVREVALSALDGNTTAKKELRDIWKTFLASCKKMGLPATGKHGVEAYLVRQLARLACDERTLGLDGVAGRLLADPKALATRAAAAGIDVEGHEAEERWRRRIERHGR